MAEHRDTSSAIVYGERTELLKNIYMYLVENGPILMRSRQRFSDMHSQECQGKACLFSM